ncbi:major facilitator superfamily domain-containing protein [Dichotomocladium elegans]|nr:major facilitator superfamily domain-containing protein [Dichotomocladium elegans]
MSSSLNQDDSTSHKEKQMIDDELERPSIQETTTKRFVRSPEEQKLFRKITWAFMPFVCLLLFVQFLDKAALTVAALFGIYEDTLITHDEFGWLGALFYVGYLAIQVPNQYMLQRVPIAKYLGVVCIGWGITVGCTALCRNFAQLAALRVLLGLWEGTCYPSLFLLVSTHYRRSEQVIWFGAMFITNAISICIGSVIGYGIGTIDGKLGIRAWKWSYIILGIITLVLGFFIFIFLPDKPKSRWFRLTETEKMIVDERILDNSVVRNRDIKRAHIYEALKEPRLYAFFLISLFLNFPNGAITTFASQIIENMGFTSLMSVIMNIPMGAVIGFLVFVFIYASHRLNDVGYVAAAASLVPALGAILMLVLPIKPVLLLGLFLCVGNAPYVLLQTYISTNVSGYTKKIFYTAGNMAAYCIGNFVGPLMMVEREAPRYTGAMVTFVIVGVITSCLFLFARWTFARENRRRQKLIDNNLMPPVPPDREELDLTDKEDLHIMYRL